MRNGELLDAAHHRFDVLITMDRNREHQQLLPRYSLAVILVLSGSNRLADTEGAIPAIERVMAEGIDPGSLYTVEPSQ